MTVLIIDQVAIAVSDARTVAKNYWNILGIGPWEIYNWEYPEVYDRIYHGKSSYGRELMAQAQVGKVKLELMQPIDEESMHKDFLREHGERFEHMRFLVENTKEVDEVAEKLLNKGYHSLQSAHCGIDGAFNYVDVRPLHNIWEIVCPPKARKTKHSLYSNMAQQSPAKVTINSIDQVGIVVENVIMATENYSSILGVGPWDILPVEEYDADTFNYYGKPAYAKFRRAIAQIGAIKIELIEPIDGHTIYNDFLMTHGGGFHHLKFEVDSANKVSEIAGILLGEGFQSLQSGSSKQNSSCHLIYIEPLRTIWEIVYLPIKKEEIR
ncbi:VOC family protein [Chloroflexota bacterium]